MRALTTLATHHARHPSRSSPTTLVTPRSSPTTLVRSWSPLSGAVVPYAAAPTRRSVERLAGASATPLWLDNPARPEAAPPLVGAEQGDLAVVGAGFTGLWTALLAKQGDPRRDVVLLEGGRVAQAATGRNGGFCSASLTHGLSNGHSRFAAELPQLAGPRCGQPDGDRADDRRVRHRLRLAPRRRPRCWPPTRTTWPTWPRRPSWRAATANRSSCWTPTRCASGWSHRATSGAC